MELNEYIQFVKEQRTILFEDVKPYDFIYHEFERLGFFKKSEDFFITNASHIVERIREEAWKNYQVAEREFTSRMLASLYFDKDIEKMSSKEAIDWFVEEYPEHIYKLSLSNTQSRRSRAGKEFEAIIELILLGANIPMDSQGNIGKKYFVNKGLGKLVDIVSPGTTEYSLNKRDTVLISAKTTLRERWQEVPEEMGRTGAREMFLVTLDTDISKDVIENLYENNIQLVTTKDIKERKYKDNYSVITFEKLIEILRENADEWNGFAYPDNARNEITSNLKIQLEKHIDHTFVYERYQRRLREMK